MFDTPFLDIPPLIGADGCVRLPGSKSISNRVLLLAGLCEGKTTLHGLLDSDDTSVMLDALRTLGCAIERDATSTAALYSIYLIYTEGHTATTGAAVDFMDTPRPAMMLVAWPVVDACATCRTGPYSVAV